MGGTLFSDFVIDPAMGIHEISLIQPWDVNFCEPLWGTSFPYWSNVKNLF